MSEDSTEQPKPEKPDKPQKRRRGKGEGSVFQRPNGTWAARLSVGFDGNGKRLTKDIYGKTKKEVTDKLTKLASQKLDGAITQDGRLTVEQFFDRWLDDAASLKVRATTLASYKQICRLHIKPKIGSIRLSKLGPAQIQNLLAEMTRDERSPRLVQMVYTLVRLALSKAVKWGFVIRNAADAVDRPSVEKHEIDVLSEEQVLQFLNAAKSDRLFAMYVVAFATGLRQGELFGLQRDDVDLVAGTLTVRRTLVELSGKITTNPPKTEKGRRLIELPEIAVKALWHHGECMIKEGLGDSVWVFPDREGGPLRRQNVLRRSFRPILKRAKLPCIRFHDMRHSSATLLLKAGVHPKIVQERLGHSQVGITMDTYSHVLPSMQKEAAGRLNDILSAEKNAIVGK